MPDGFIQLPADSTGKKLRTTDRGTAGHDQYVRIASPGPSYAIWSGFQAGAGSKNHLVVFNNATATKALRVPKLFIQTNMAAITGVGHIFDIDRISDAGLLGTAITPNPSDTADGALANVTCHAAPTTAPTKVLTLFSVGVDPEETRPGAALAGMINWMPEGNDLREITLQPGQGFRVMQVTANTAATWGMLAVVTVED